MISPFTLPSNPNPPSPKSKSTILKTFSGDGHPGTLGTVAPWATWPGLGTLGHAPLNLHLRWHSAPVPLRAPGLRPQLRSMGLGRHYGQVGAGPRPSAPDDAADPKRTADHAADFKGTMDDTTLTMPPSPLDPPGRKCMGRPRAPYARGRQFAGGRLSLYIEFWYFFDLDFRVK